jgi:transposase InsO family protein
VIGVQTPLGERCFIRRRSTRIRNVAPSMSRKGCCYDNAAMKSFFATLKIGYFQNRISHAILRS